MQPLYLPSNILKPHVVGAHSKRPLFLHIFIRSTQWDPPKQPLYLPSFLSPTKWKPSKAASTHWELPQKQPIFLHIFCSPTPRADRRDLGGRVPRLWMTLKPWKFGSVFQSPTRIGAGGERRSPESGSREGCEEEFRLVYDRKGIGN